MKIFVESSNMVDTVSETSYDARALNEGPGVHYLGITPLERSPVVRYGYVESLKVDDEGHKRLTLVLADRTDRIMKKATVPRVGILLNLPFDFFCNFKISVSISNFHFNEFITSVILHEISLRTMYIGALIKVRKS